MKNILAENMLRFAPKNLTEASKRKLEQLVEQDLQTVEVKPKVDMKLFDGSAFNVGEVTPPDPAFFKKTGKIFYYCTGDQTLYFYSSATDTTPMTLSANNTFNLNTAIDFIVDLAAKSYNSKKPNQTAIGMILKSLGWLQARVSKYKGGGVIKSKILDITRLLAPYGNKDFKTLQYLATTEFKGKKYPDARYMQEFGIGLYIWLGNQDKPGFKYDPSKPTSETDKLAGSLKAEPVPRGTYRTIKK